MSPPSLSVQAVDTIHSPQSTQQSSLPPADSAPDSHEQHPQRPLTSPRPMRKYTRQQLVSLSSSPLVKPPPNMPDLKVWFGSENENLTKKEEPTTPNAARDRRFRRDAEDGDPPSRPTFRTALTQPSQMGNFKHQSLRGSDRDRERDRERDGEKEREREIRDKEGHERLRHLSDKFDRDRLALPLSGPRKERDAAPHLNNSNSRTSQTLSSNAASRRAETREATKKKVGEASEDWRRGAEPPRSTRDERPENGRREDRDRARSRVRDSSRPKRDTSVSHRDREDPREKLPRGDREGDEHRRDKDETRRDRENDTDDDPRRWRDDGKRDERLAARRERGRDKDNWEGTDKRWGAGDDRDGRYKRTGRERKTGNAPYEVKEKEDRREKEREKEKEPAWMDTYIPSENMSGILGGQGANGELDGIQAWKKGMKEKESKEKDANAQNLSKDSRLEQPSLLALPENMDEIQLFKLLMKQEEKKRIEIIADSAVTGEPTSLAVGKSEDLTSSTQPCPRDPDNVQPVQSPFRNILSAPMENASQDSPSGFPFSLKDLGKALPIATAEPSAEQLTLPTKLPTPASASDSSLRVAPPKLPGDVDANFQPPPGSRLLAFARPPIKSGSPGNTLNNLQALNGSLQAIGSEPSQGFAKNEPPRPQSGFSPFEDQRQLYGFDEPRNVNLPQNMHSRAPMEQTFNANIAAQVETGYNNGLASKGGSRFAKFFDGKSRDGLPTASKPLGGFNSPSPNHLQRQEQVSLVTGTSNDQRAMEELFAMLNNSSQRGNLVHGPQSNPNPIMNNQPYGTPGPSLHALQHQHLLQPPQIHSNRLEPLYDSRADDRSFVPDGMVPGLRPIPPPPSRGRDGPFIDHLEESLPYNFQRIPHQQPQPQQHIRNIDPLYTQTGPAPLFAQQSGRSSGGLNMQSLQQPHLRGGPSPNISQGTSVPNAQQQQRLPPGLANLGGRPPHDPSQFIGLPGLPSNVPHNAIHGNGPLALQQLPFNNFNGANNMGFSNTQIRGPIPGPNLHHTNPQQHPLGSLGPNVDPRLPNPHHLMGLGGSGNNGGRTNGGFPQQGPTTPSHIGMRPQQQQQQAQLLPHMLPHLIPPHLQQQGHPGSNNPPAHDLMALLMGGPHRE